MSFDIHKMDLIINERSYVVPATTLTDEQVRHMVAYAARVKIERAGAGLADDQAKMHERRTARVETVYAIEAGGPRRSPVETETMNLYRAWLRDNGAKAEALKTITSIEKAEAYVAAILKDDPVKGTSAERAAKLTRVLTAKATEIVAARSTIEADV